MKLEEEIKNSIYYSNYRDLPVNRKNFLEKESGSIKNIKEKLFDYCSIEEIYLTDDFLLKEVVNPELSIFIKINDNAFIEFLDRRDEMLTENISVMCCVQGTCYKVSLNEIKECEKPEVMVLIPDEKSYKV